MAASSSSFSKKINRYNLLTFSLLLLFSLFCFLFLNRTAIDPKLTDLALISQSPSPLLLPNSSSSSNPQQNVDPNFKPSSISSSKDKRIVPISQNSDLDDGKRSEPSVSMEPSSVSSSNEERKVPISSNSDLGSGSPEPELEDDSGETSKPDIDEKSDGKLEGGGGKGESLKEGASLGGFGGIVIDNVVLEKLRNCDIYKGKWVRDEGYPVYKPGSCPYVDEAFDCQRNGRPDSAYTQWRWKPDQCELPRFNATDFLVRLRGKRLMLVGDSMNRNQFESLLCLLREALPDKSKMYETRGNKITKGRGYFIFKFVDYNCTVEFVRSHFLVREGVRINPQGNSNPTLSIDRIDKSATRWLRADILVFNTGHWWTHGKTSKGKNYFKEGDYIYPRFDSVEAYRRAIATWAMWVKRNVNRNKLVIYRGYSSAHFRGGEWDSGGSCNGETEPVVQGAIIDSYPQKMTIVEETIKKMQASVVLLNVTRLTNYRKDGHPSVYGKNVTGLKKVSTRKQDCSHWCLPGVPDAWNELIYATLVARQT